MIKLKTLTNTLNNNWIYVVNICFGLIILYPILTYKYSFVSSGDSADQSLCWLGKIFGAARDGQVVLWDFTTQCGTSFIGELQTSPLYWPALVFGYFASGGVLSSFDAFLVFHFLICALGMQVFAQSTGLSKISSFFTAILFCYGSTFSLRVCGQPNLFASLAWMPWIVWSCRMALVKSRFTKTIIFSMLAGFFIASSFLAGHVHSVILSAIAAGIFVFFSLSEISSYKIQRFLLLIFTGGIVTIGLSLPQLLATREYLKLSYKWYGEGYTEYPHVVPFEKFLESALSFQDMLTAITGRGVAAVDGGTFFITITGLIFAIIGLLFGLFLLQCKTSVYWPSFAILLLSISFAYSIVWPLGVIFYNFPIINLVRAPSRALFLFAFAGSLMAGIGLNIIIDKASCFFKKNKIPHSQILASCCGMLFLLSSSYELFHWFPARTFQPLEKYSVAASLILSDPVSNKLVELTKESGYKYRYYASRDDLAPNIGNLFPLFSAHGYRSSRTKIFHDYFDFNPLSERSNLLGVRWWVSKNKIENLKLLYTIDGRNIYERETCPLFYQLNHNSNVASRIVEQVKWKTNAVSVEFTNPIKGPLIFAQPFFPGFYAFADGVAYEIHNYSNLMGINLLAPAKKVDFIYRPKWFTYGIVVSIITAALCIFTFIFFCRNN